jgi:Flp pilus assembly protein TadG
MRRLRALIRARSGAAAAEMAMVAPFLLILMFGSLELGSLFMDQHALEKQVRDGARFAARLEISDDYSCPGTVFAASDANDQIINVTKTGATTGSGNPRWGSYWSRTCDGATQPVTVAIRCVSKDDIDTGGSGNTGIYTTLAGDDIPVVSVTAAVKYQSVFAALGFDSSNICLRAESEAPVQGL